MDLKFRYCLLWQIVFCIQSLLSESSEITIQLPNGPIKGVPTQTRITNSSRIFYSFLGVRYAKAPVGELRLKPPQPLDPWTEVYDATYEKFVCYQVNLDTDAENEDCLFLNVYTPTDPTTINDKTELLPIMMFIHGGGFVQGSGLKSGTGDFGGDYHMEYGVLMVSINYRLGPFGFFSTGDTVIPGNLGLKDQNMAIQWLRQNAKYFGGDPDKITIFGQSAGSASVSYQLLSSNSEGLFRAAICESGTALVPWAFQRNQTEITYATAGVINDKFNDPKNRNSTELLAFLMAASAKDIDQASYKIYLTADARSNQIVQGFFYAPVVEVDHEEAFITELMYEAAQEGHFVKVPVMLGINAEEAVAFYNSDFNGTIEAVVIDPTLLVPNDMHLSPENETTVGNLILTEYLGDNSNNQRSTSELIKYYSDQCFNRGAIRMAELQSKFTDVFFYIFSYHGFMGGNKVTYPGTGNVTHSEELPYLFVKTIESDTPNVWLSTSNLTQFSPQDVQIHYKMMKVWTNFAKNLNPTPQSEDLLDNVIWPKVNIGNGNEFQYLDLGATFSVKTNPRSDHYSFWKNLYDVYGVKPFDTY